MELPPWLQARSDLGVVVCAQHGSSYVQTTLDRHLRDTHQMAAKERKKILENQDFMGNIADIPSHVQRPSDGISPIQGLPVYDNSFQCQMDPASCRHFSRNEVKMKEHCRDKHRTALAVSERQGKKNLKYLTKYKSGLRIQTLFKETKYVAYFPVEVPTETGRQSARAGVRKVSNQESNLGSNSKQNCISTEGSEERLRQYLQVLQDLEDEQMQNTKIGEVQHVSELSNWLKQTGYHAYLNDLDRDEFPKAHKLPDPSDERVLAVICASVKRLFLKGSHMLDFDETEQRMLSNLHARLLNTFRKSEISLDPIKSLQNKKSKQNYIEMAQSLISYFYRVQNKLCLTKRKMFTLTTTQIFKWGELEAAAEALAGAESSACRVDSNEDNEKETLEQKLDRHTLDFFISLITHRLALSSFDSVIISFVAVRSWSTHRRTFIKIGVYSSMLAKLTYVCQLLVLLHCIAMCDEDETTFLSDWIIEFRDKWMLNNSESPVGTILSMRLLARRIARMEVQQVTIRWPDEQTVSYGDIRISMQQVRTLLRHELEAAKKVFQEDLCFGLKGIPQYDPCDLIENWQADQPSASFLNNSQNSVLLEGSKTWLYNKINGTPDVSETVFQRHHDAVWRVKSDVVDMYEKAVQRFLEHMALVLHIGSGQPARRPEFLGLRWRNRDKAVRNIYVEKGRMVFILSYHKMLHVHNASRFPVRVLLPEAAQLLTQYLALIIPFRSWMLKMSKQGSAMSSYLWADDKGIWKEDRFTRMFKSRAMEVIGVKLTLQAWRQIAVAIAIKFFGGGGRVLETAMNEDEDEDGLQLNEESGAMPESFHWQASHTPRTGNGAYASRIDYQGGLTDEGLNEYIRISNMWQALLAEGTDIQLSGGKHARGQSVEGSAVAPLLKRIALRHASQRYRRHWSMEEAKAALQDMYGPDAKYKSEWQERAVQAVVSGLTPVVVVLGTGEGKSLLYMLQQRLPGAGTTVIIVPLVVLKQDTVRRCQQMGIDCLVWDHAIGGRIGNELVLVSVDRALSQEFQDELQALSSSGRLSSIIVDECHLVVTASEYRPKMTMVREFRRYACQMVFLTATLPLHMMMAFADRFLLANAVVIRGPTLRKDIQYEVRRCVGMDVCREAVGLVQALLRLDLFVYDEKARLIVYCVTKDDVNAVADALGCQRYYSDSASHREKEQAMAEWMNGESRVMVATSAFGAGVDYHSVRSIVHVGVPDSTVDFAQEVGRGGRDGGGCISYVVVPRHWRSGNRRAGGELMAADQMAMQKYLDSPRCRQTVLGGYLDENSYVCESTQTMCDRCQGLGLVKKAQEDDEEKVEERLWMSTGGEEWGEGARRTEETQKQETRDKQLFMANLELVKGMCGICLVEGGIELGRGHSLDTCKKGGKFRFFDMKKQLKKKYGRSWVAKYSACTGCGLSQEMCDELAAGKCRYRDFAIPISWAVYKNARWEGLQDRLGAPTVRSEIDWMLWLGQRRLVFGETGTEMLRVTAAVLHELVSAFDRDS